jgi:TPR repeat protein
MINRGISVLTLCLSLTVFCEARADFESAWEAYKQGQYNFAVREFLWCAEKGNDLCQLYLADIYYYGHGTMVRRDKAIYWYLKSARQKNVAAAVGLYALYSRTLSIPGNNVKAYMWFKIAKILGKDLSLKKEARLIARMSVTEIDEAQRQAAEWWIKFQ